MGTRPVRRWRRLVGHVLGMAVSAGLVVLVFGVVPRLTVPLGAAFERRDLVGA